MDIYYKLLRLLPSPALLFVKKEDKFTLNGFSPGYLSLISQHKKNLLGLCFRDAVRYFSIEEPVLSEVEKRMIFSAANKEYSEFVITTTKGTSTRNQTSWRIELTPLKEDEFAPVKNSSLVKVC